MVLIERAPDNFHFLWKVFFFFLPMSIFLLFFFFFFFSGWLAFCPVFPHFPAPSSTLIVTSVSHYGCDPFSLLSCTSFTLLPVSGLATHRLRLPSQHDVSCPVVALQPQLLGEIMFKKKPQSTRRRMHADQGCFVLVLTFSSPSPNTCDVTKRLCHRFLCT